MSITIDYVASRPLTGIEGFIATCAPCKSFLIEVNGVWHHMNDRCAACYGVGYDFPDPNCPLEMLHGVHTDTTPGMNGRECPIPTPELCGANPHCIRPLDVEHPCKEHRDCCGNCCIPE